MEKIKTFFKTLAEHAAIIAVIGGIIYGIGWYYVHHTNYDDSTTVRNEIESAKSSTNTIQKQVSESTESIRNARDTVTSITNTTGELQTEGQRTADGISKLGESIQSTKESIECMGDSISRFEHLQSDKSEIINSATGTINNARDTTGSIREELTTSQSELDELTTTAGEIGNLLQQLRESCKEDGT